MSLLEVKNLSISYKIDDVSYVAVSEVNFVLEEGQVLGIAGASGSGKSTIAKGILGILPDNALIEGEIIFQGKNLLAFNRKEMEKIRGREISMVFQDPSTALNPVRIIKRQFYDILARVAKDKAVLDKMIVSKLESVHLEDALEVMNKYPHELSGGMKQRIVIAAALCLSPRILIADEPTSAIDASIKKQIILELKGLKISENLSMIYISHNLAELKSICDEIIVMKDSKIIEQNATAALFNCPKEPYTIELIDAVV
ncbi:ABC transporter ATP-binding protein [Acetobacterium bakii]|uniref:ABC transporter ATP-binding protein n=1 Tax=Acetobacterium bakii TaxID=52689 RepID=UPI000683118C|nr:ABC transporter ATP-binding protein [Acetobacterium bakii]